MKKEKKRKLNGLDLYVIFSILALIVFTVVTQVMLFMNRMVSETLITCYFAFFGSETVSCAILKIFKLKEEGRTDGITVSDEECGLRDEELKSEDGEGI
jgi:hypothetical protein